jgi:hypothetical protein
MNCLKSTNIYKDWSFLDHPESNIFIIDNGIQNLNETFELADLALSS